jgi:hypothetical protein
MKPPAEKMLNAAMDRVHYTQVEVQNFAKRAPGAIKAWKAHARNMPGDNIKQIVKTVVPVVDKLVGKSKQVLKDLDKLQDAGDTPHDYYDGAEFRSRNIKLLNAAKDFDREAAKVVLTLKSMGLYPAMTVAEVKSTMFYIAGYMERWNALKIAINRI